MDLLFNKEFWFKKIKCIRMRKSVRCLLSDWRQEGQCRICRIICMTALSEGCFLQSRGVSVQLMRWSDTVWQLMGSEVDPFPYLTSGCVQPPSILYQLLFSSEIPMSVYHALISMPEGQQKKEVWLLKRDGENCS